MQEKPIQTTKQEIEKLNAQAKQWLEDRQAVRELLEEREADDAAPKMNERQADQGLI